MWVSMPRLTLNRCWKLNKLLYDDAVATDDPALRAKIALAWDKICERGRILQHIPLPKAVDVLAKRHTRRGAELEADPSEESAHATEVKAPAPAPEPEN